MLELLNVLYVLTEGSVLHLDHDALRVEVEGSTRARLPLLQLSGVVVFGRVTVTPFLIHRCAQDGRNLVWLSRTGRFLARVEGPARGNVLLRRAQHLALSDRPRAGRIARQFVAAKIQNCRQVLQRAARDMKAEAERALLGVATDRLGNILTRLRDTQELELVRGFEGDAARTYFGVFDQLIRSDAGAFSFDGRNRRPPRNRINAMLSFLYALVRAECSAAIEGVGLDPQVGYLHSLRPGRPALALDLMEELRPVFADRLALSLVNRRQIKPDHFEEQPGGAVLLNDEGRRTVIAAYQQRKSEEVQIGC